MFTPALPRTDKPWERPALTTRRHGQEEQITRAVAHSITVGCSQVQCQTLPISTVSYPGSGQLGQGAGEEFEGWDQCLLRSPSSVGAETWGLALKIPPPVPFGLVLFSDLISFISIKVYL
jgi:hypothetical protein